MNKMPKKTKNIIKEFVKQINNLLGDRIKKVILYGSYARGDYKDNSDIDIMILTDLTDEEIIEYREQVSNIAFDIEFENDFDITISPLIKNINKFEFWTNVLPFYMNIQKEGEILSESKTI